MLNLNFTTSIPSALATRNVSSLQGRCGSGTGDRSRNPECNGNKPISGLNRNDALYSDRSNDQLRTIRILSMGSLHQHYWM